MWCILWIAWLAYNIVHIVRLVDVVDNSAAAVGRTASNGTQWQLTWLWTYAPCGGLLVFTYLVRLIRHNGTIVWWIESRVALGIVDHSLGYVWCSQLWRQLRVVLAAAAGVVRLVMLAVAAVQRIVVDDVVAADAIDGVGVAAWSIRGYLIGISAHCGGHLGAWSRQYAITQCNILQFLIDVHIAGHCLGGADSGHQLHIVIQRAIALVDLGATRIVTSITNR